MINCSEELDIIALSEVDSTNNYIATLVRSSQITKTTIVSADYQTDGRGQRASKWQSAKAQNALFSIYVPWKELRIVDQFLVSMLAAITVSEVLEHYIFPQVQIKWPNDIFINKKKIGGILIESDLSREFLNASIIGIGLNVNQVNFDSPISATSLKLETGQQHDRIGLIKQIGYKFIENCVALNSEPDAFNLVKKSYLKRLLGLNKTNRVIQSSTGKQISIKPLDITRSGLLLATDENNVLHTFDLKEINWQF